MDCVVDASVGAKLYVAEELSDRAETLFLHLTSNPPATMCVPDLYRLECANFLWKQIRRGACDLTKAILVMEDLADLALVWVPESLLAGDALRLAAALDITVYDATYAALATLEQLPLVTADERLARKLCGSGIPVVSLADYEGD